MICNARLRTLAVGLIIAAGAIHLNAAPANQPTPATSADVKVRPEEALIPVKRVNALARGMTAEQVKELLGNPTRVAAVPGAAVKSEIWTYRISVKQTTEQIAASMHDVTVFDPLSNGTKTVQEPTYQLLYVRTYTTLELLMVDGKLIERKGGREVDRSYY